MLACSDRRNPWKKAAPDFISGAAFISGNRAQSRGLLVVRAKILVTLLLLLREFVEERLRFIDLAGL